MVLVMDEWRLYNIMNVLITLKFILKIIKIIIFMLHLFHFNKNREKYYECINIIEVYT